MFLQFGVKGGPNHILNIRDPFMSMNNWCLRVKGDVDGEESGHSLMHNGYVSWTTISVMII